MRKSKTKKILNENNRVQLDPRFRPIVDAFARAPHVTVGKMMSSHGLKVNGKIFAMFGRGQFVVKLPREKVDELVDSGRGQRFDPGHGRLMKEWVVVAAGQADWVELAKQAHQFVKQGANE